MDTDNSVVMVRVMLETATTKKVKDLYPPGQYHKLTDWCSLNCLMTNSHKEFIQMRSTPPIPMCPVPSHSNPFFPKGPRITLPLAFSKAFQLKC